jgi:hypothetical protein
MQRLSWVLVLFALIVAGCGGGGSNAVAPGAQNGTATGTATIVIPPGTTTSSSNRSAQFISPSVASVRIAMAGLADQIFALTTSSSNCATTAGTRTCTINFTATAGQPSITVTLYDAANGTGNVLGSATTTANVTAGTAFTVSLTIGGAIKTVTINLSNAFTMGTAGTATVTVTAQDAGGNTIAGPGNFALPVTLQNTDTTGALTLSGTTIAGPGSSVTLTYNGSSSVSSTSMINASVAQSGVQVNSAAVFGTSSSPAPVSCGTALPIPGTYTEFYSWGTYAGTTYTANTAAAFSGWVRFSVTAATPTPSPSPTSSVSPSPSPSPTRTPQPVYLYIGTFQLASGSSGCSFLITSQDGSALAAYNGTGTAGSSGQGTDFPNITGAYNLSGFTSGTINSFVVNNLSATGGSGNVTLSNGDTGTVTLSTRFSSTLDNVRKTIEQIRRQ